MRLNDLLGVLIISTNFQFVFILVLKSVPRRVLDFFPFEKYCKKTYSEAHLFGAKSYYSRNVLKTNILACNQVVT